MMGVKRVFLGVMVVAACAWLAGCAPKPAPDTKATRQPTLDPIPDAGTLMGWAKKLGARELEKLAAAEMLYRNHTYQHLLNTGDLDPVVHYGKYFREFRSFDVENIELTGSVIHPVKYTIRYDFDLFGTVFRRGQLRDTHLAEEARADYFVTPDLRDSILREYESDEGCRPIDAKNPVLERPNYWAYRTDAIFGHTWDLNDVTE